MKTEVVYTECPDCRDKRILKELGNLFNSNVKEEYCKRCNNTHVIRTEYIKNDIKLENEN